MVTNRLDRNMRLDPKPDNGHELHDKSESDVAEEEMRKVVPGPITWQLYVSRATSGDRLNN